MNNVHGKLYQEINQFLFHQGNNSIAPPLVIYHAWSDTLVDIEVGISVNDSNLLGNNRINMNKINKTK